MAFTVGKRHGQLIILNVQSKAMKVNGYVFYQSAKGVWLTDGVPINYIDFRDSRKSNIRPDKGH